LTTEYSATVVFPTTHTQCVFTELTRVGYGLRTADYGKKFLEPGVRSLEPTSEQLGFLWSSY
jgi:hypothetical protein